MSSTGGLRELTRPAPRRGTAYKDNRAAYAFLAPWLLGIVLITIGPVLVSLYLSFTDYNLLQPPDFTGLENYAEMFGDPKFLASLKVTLTYVVLSVPLQLALALGLAMLLDRGLRGLSLYRSVLYLPSMLGASVAVAILWRQVFGSAGLVNQFLGWFGIEGQGWISNPSTALGTIVLLHIWTFGSPMVIFLAGLRQIPRMYYEAAEVDGAAPLRRFRSVTLPLLSPIIFFNLVLQVIYAFQSFTQAFIVSSGTGGPSDSTLFTTLYIYKEGFGRFHMGYASAMAWVLLVVVAAFTAVNFWASRFWVFYDD
ncbi:MULTISPECIES: carbohydrate ABC transporter permease [Streptomyces]|uniref:Sugar ABC transporter permease n=1 Tax=Streptomyces lycii TaxID=2654337 RepID=A0ABQ7FNS4_9ACTN|nr:MULTISPECIES: sugar ABC transporter permease [Streptomyces]KAF4410268.1 sugar ABC transporter permease [Streptomyces lycii]PGH46957.1 ABC transporter permease [Streptomyces sp. Ru87]